MIFHGIFLVPLNTCASKWTRNGKHKFKLVRPEKKWKVYGAQTRKNANPGLHQKASVKLFHTHFSVTRTSVLKKVLFSILASSDFIKYWT